MAYTRLPINRVTQAPRNAEEIRRRAIAINQHNQPEPDSPFPQDDDFGEFKAIISGVSGAIKGAGNRLGHIVNDIPQSGKMRHVPQLEPVIPMVKPIFLRV